MQYSSLAWKRGLFPHENSITEMEGLEEERRLMYVAITRARKRLYISFTQSQDAAWADPLQHSLALF
jgi:superfamily I DNA/RNA helicase